MNRSFCRDGQEALDEGVNTMLKIALGILASNRNKMNVDLDKQEDGTSNIYSSCPLVIRD